MGGGGNVDAGAGGESNSEESEDAARVLQDMELPSSEEDGDDEERRRGMEMPTVLQTPVRRRPPSTATPRKGAIPQTE